MPVANVHIRVGGTPLFTEGSDLAPGLNSDAVEACPILPPDNLSHRRASGHILNAEVQQGALQTTTEAADRSTLLWSAITR